MKTSTLVNRTAREIGLAWPVLVTVYRGDGTPEDNAGSHYVRRRRHRIEIGLKNTRGFHEVLAHEMAHALVEEAHPKAEAHGVEFAVAMLLIICLWRSWGIELNALMAFNPEVDP